MPQDSEAVSLLRKLVQLYSPSGREKRVASVVHRWLAAQSSFDEVVIDSAGNVVATRGSGPYLLLCGHMDTVPGRLPVTFKNGMIRGRGAVGRQGVARSHVYGFLIGRKPRCEGLYVRRSRGGGDQREGHEGPFSPRDVSSREGSSASPPVAESS